MSNLPLSLDGRGASRSDAVGTAVIAALAVAIDQGTGSTNRLVPIAVHVVLVKR